MSWLLNTFSRLPLSVLYGVSRFIYVFLYYVIRYRRDVVQENIFHAFPELKQNQRKDLEKRFYQHLSRVLVETAKSASIPADELRKRMTFTNMQVLREPLDNHQPVLLLTSHQGNWEWLLQAVSLELPCPLEAIYKPLHNTEVDKWMKAIRTRFGGRLIPFREAGRQLLKNRGQLRVFALANDQVPSKKDLQYWHPFMGRDAAFFFSPQKLAEATQYTAIYARLLNDTKMGHYTVEFIKLGNAPYEKNGTELIDKYIQVLEESIRLQPESWLWSNRKWKRSKPGPKAVFSPLSRFSQHDNS
jgi:KDO2-lipid IV(A) lauroyltransferase